jgi:hypothetical protein
MSAMHPEKTNDGRLFQRNSSMTLFIFLYAITKGTNPNIPNEQSTMIQKYGIPRIGPQISAIGINNTHAIIPNSTTHIFLTGSRNAPRNAIAIVI